MRRLAAIVLATVLVLAWALPAYGAVWTEPAITALAGSLVEGDGPWLELPWTVAWQVDGSILGSPLDPRAVERLANGNTLVTSRDSRGVYEIDPVGTVVWSYTTADDPLLTPFHASRTPQGTTLIVDRWQECVFEVDAAKNVIWRYGVPDDPTRQGDDDLEAPDPGELLDPFTATRLDNGNTLIAENQACRVLVIRSSDYEAAGPNDGYTEASIVWQYGVIGELSSEHDYADGYLDWPKYAVRLGNGNTLIADEAAHRVVEVTPSGSVVWAYGTPGVPGRDPGFLNEPASAERLADGTTLIADGKNNRVIRVDGDGEIVWEFSATSLLDLDDEGLIGPRRAIITDSGSILIADEGHDRLIELGYQATGTGTSASLDCGLPGARKQFSAITVTADAPEDTRVDVAYSIDGAAWQTLTGTALPAATYGTLIRYRVTLATTRLDVTPRLLAVSIAYEAAPEQNSDDPGDGEGTGGDDDDDDGGDGGTPARRPTRPRPSAPVSSGTKDAGVGYAEVEEVTVEEGLSGALTAQRGWMMSSITTGALTDGTPGTAAPAPSPEGLALLGAIYASGVVSVPTGALLARMLNRVRTAPPLTEA